MSIHRRLLTVVTLVVLCAAMMPAHSSGAMRCDIVATVTLAQNENLFQVNGGSGTISGNYVCEGTEAGASLSGPGSFYFCQHLPSGFNPNCVNPEDPNTEDVADAASNAGPVVTDIQGNINIALNTGVSCSLTLNGHSYLVVADLVLNNFTCNDGFGQPGGAEIARADATAAIIIDPTITCTPGPAQACFRQLAFVGQLLIVDE